MNANSLTAQLDAVEEQIAREDDRVISEWRERYPKQAATFAALKAVVEPHYGRTITTRTDECRYTDRACEGMNDPCCFESCLHDIEICNSCGTQDSCKIRRVIAEQMGMST